MRVDRSLKERVASVLHEATPLALSIDPVLRTASLWISTLTLPPDDGPAGDQLELRLTGVTRVAAAYRKANWDDRNAVSIPVELEDLSEVFCDFGPMPIYGDDFLDSEERWMRHWAGRLSLDWRVDGESAAHTLDLFQEGFKRHIDLRIWFDEFGFYGSAAQPMRLEELVDATDRWWAAMRSGDPRTHDSGIGPLE